MKDLPKSVEPMVVTSVTDERGEETEYRGVSVTKLISDGKAIEEVVWLLWTGKMPSDIQKEIARRIIILTADHGPSVAGAYTTILAASAGLYLPQSVAAGVQMIGPRFGGAAGLAANSFHYAVENNLDIPEFNDWMKSQGKHTFPGIGHKVYSKSHPDLRVVELVKFVQNNLKKTPHVDFALKLEQEMLKKNEKLILNIDGAIGAVLVDLDFPLEGIDGFFVLARTIGLIAHYIDQKQRGTGLIRLPEELVLYKK